MATEMIKLTLNEGSQHHSYSVCPLNSYLVSNKADHNNYHVSPASVFVYVS